MRFVYLALSMSLLALPACKQGQGERCQVDSDCEDGLLCAPATKTCEHTASGGFDASPDAIPIDAGIDAMPDAAPMPDAMPDAMVDAAL
jgi:hypothetical protein